MRPSAAGQVNNKQEVSVKFAATTDISTLKCEVCIPKISLQQDSLFYQHYWTLPIIGNTISYHFKSKVHVYVLQMKFYLDILHSHNFVFDSMTQNNLLMGIHMTGRF